MRNREKKNDEGKYRVIYVSCIGLCYMLYIASDNRCIKYGSS